MYETLYDIANLGIQKLFASIATQKRDRATVLKELIQINSDMNQMIEGLEMALEEERRGGIKE